MKKATITLQEMELPEFGKCAEMPEIPTTLFEQRFTDTIAQMKARGYDFLLVFADRENNECA